jgi:predicted N-acetyltransferase YhbS
LLTKIKIVQSDRIFESLAMAPVAVLPEFQNRGIGGKLILSAHQAAKELGYKSIVVLGHADYYPRFGYQLTQKHNIELPFPADKENCMVIELVENGLKGVSGKVEYPQEFYQ